MIKKFEIIFNDLKKKDILVLPRTLEKYKHQGWMSTVYTVKTNKGKLIIHLVKLVKEHKINQIWDKFSGLATIFSFHKEIPAPRILYSRLSGEVFILVQEFFEGRPAGKRVLRETIISDKWSSNRYLIIPEVLRLLANVHKVHLNGFGWPIIQNSLLIGKHDTWKNFFDANIFIWLEEIGRADRRLSLDNSNK
jgi:hypothetical protein